MLGFKNVKLQCQFHLPILLLQVCASRQKECGFGTSLQPSFWEEKGWPPLSLVAYIMTMDQAETWPLLLESYREIGWPWALLWKLVWVLFSRFENHIMLKSLFSWAWELLLVARRESSSTTFWLDYLLLFPFQRLNNFCAYCSESLQSLFLIYPWFPSTFNTTSWALRLQLRLNY